MGVGVKEFRPDLLGGDDGLEGTAKHLQGEHAFRGRRIGSSMSRPLSPFLFSVTPCGCGPNVDSRAVRQVRGRETPHMNPNRFSTECLTRPSWIEIGT
jgi:hypothetical protein